MSAPAETGSERRADGRMDAPAATARPPALAAGSTVTLSAYGESREPSDQIEDQAQGGKR